MNTSNKNTPSKNGMIELKETAQTSERTAELQIMFENLCVALDGVIPAEVFDMLKQVQPLEAAIKLLWEFGGRISTNHPEVDLKSGYDYPEEVDNLDDTIGDFSFSIAPTPFVAISQATLGNINADEEIIQACDLKDFVPLIIEKEGDIQRICLIDFVSRTLEVPIGTLFSIGIDMSGTPSEQRSAMEEGLEELGDHLDALKQQLKKPPQMFASHEEEEAVRAWCEKHDYRVVGVFRAGMDCYL